MILLVGAALMIRTFASLRAVDPGFDPHNVLTLQTSLSGGRYDTTAKVDNLIRQMTPAWRACLECNRPRPPLCCRSRAASTCPSTSPASRPPRALCITATSNGGPYRPTTLRRFKIPLLRGRVFSEHDTGNSARVIIVNEALAKKYWQNEDPIGHVMTVGKGLGPEFEEPAREIVGIVGNVRENGLTGSRQSVMYVPAGQITDGLTQLANKVIPLSWIVRTVHGTHGAHQSTIQHEFLAVDGQLPVAKFRTMEQVISESTARVEFQYAAADDLCRHGFAAGGARNIRIDVVFGGAADPGDRHPRGAGRQRRDHAAHGDPARSVAGRASDWQPGWRPPLASPVLLSSLLFGVKANDPIAFGAVVLTLAAVAWLAVYIPARRATRIDPLIALRYE